MLILANVPALFYFSLSRSLMRKRMLHHVIIINFLTAFILCVGAILCEDAKLNLHRRHGLFGWLCSDLAFTSIFWMGFFATFCGSIGYLLSMQFYSPMACMNAYLLEPVFAQILGCVFGVDKRPGLLTIAGVIAIAVATVMVNKGTNAMIDGKLRVMPVIQDDGAGQSGRPGDLEADGLELEVASGTDVKIHNHIEKMQEKIRLMKLSKETLEQ